MEDSNKKELKEKILNLLTVNARAYNQEELKDLLDLNDFNLLSQVLLDLEKEMKVVFTNKKRYALYDNKNIRTGILSVNKRGFGFVDIEGTEPDAFIQAKNLNKAIHGDKVVIELISKNSVDLEGRVVRILERNNDLVGEFFMKDGNAFVDIDDAKMLFNASIPADKTLGAVAGHKVLIKLGKQLKDGLYAAEITKIIGHKNDPGTDILAEAAKFHIFPEFPQEVMDELATLPKEVKEADLIGRRDLREEEIFTIDGDDTKDIDDAISIKKLDNGNYLLGVHIADVSHYVVEGGAIDKEAYKRGTSYYLGNTVIPMLPHALSNGICSLNPNVDRLTFSCDMEISPKGKILTYDIYEGVIKSQIQMTYNKVNKVLSGIEMPEGYAKHEKTLKLMLELSKIFRKAQFERGGIEFDTSEAKIKIDSNGKPIDIIRDIRGDGEKLIEQFMIAANQSTANVCEVTETPTVYRVHDKPKEERFAEFVKYCSLLGYKLEAKYRNNMYPKTLQTVNEQLKEKPEYPILARLLIRLQAKAIYHPKNIGHFALALKEYLHFTSPIRRYPDLISHRQIKKARGITPKLPNSDAKDASYMLVAGEHCSLTEQNGDKCEREVESMKKAEYMLGFIGEEFDGMITETKNFGFFVELDNTVEGLVHIDELNKGKYKFFFDEASRSFRADNCPISYRLGQKIKVECISANKDEKKVDFIIAKQLEKEDLQITKEKVR